MIIETLLVGIFAVVVTILIKGTSQFISIGKRFIKISEQFSETNKRMTSIESGQTLGFGKVYYKLEELKRIMEINK